MAARTIEDRLREEYDALLPGLTRVAEHLKTQVQYSLLPIARKLKHHESLIVKARVKECTSAIDKLRRSNPGGVFDRERPEIHTLFDLHDLVGVRVLAFPPAIAAQVDRLLRLQFPDWTPDPIKDEEGEPLAFKYNGQYAESSQQLPCEYQIVSTLIGLFWDIEHTAIYKQAPNLKGLAPVMRQQISDVYRALKAFEDEFERQIRISESSTPVRRASNE